MADILLFLLSDNARLLRKRFDIAARSSGATGAQWRVLLNLFRQPGMTQAGLAEILDVEPITTCRMVDRLEQAGLVERRADPNDRRAWRIFPTERALPLIDELHAVGEKILETATIDMTPADITILTSLLGRVRTNLSTDDTQHPNMGAASHG